MNQESMKNLCASILANNELLRNAQRKAGSRVNGSSTNLTNCCAATLSYLLIDILRENLKPTNRAMKLAYILEHEAGFTRIEVGQPILVGDVGVVDHKKNKSILANVEDNFQEDGDTFDPIEIFENDDYQYNGHGYIEDDPDNLKWHHIYLVVKNAEDPLILQIVDNQNLQPHMRPVKGGAKSPTKYFLRAK